MPEPAEGAKAVRVVLGRGTQNYSCSGASGNKPVPTGAVATLYDVSCIAGSSQLLSALPGLIINMDMDLISKVAKDIAGTDQIVAGHHYFSNEGFPVFNFSTESGNDVFVGRKLAQIQAPSCAVNGTDNQAFGAVDWLQLDTRNKSVGSIKVCPISLQLLAVC